MKNKKHTARAYGRWQYLTIAVSLLLLALCALPNWYGKRPVLILNQDYQPQQVMQWLDTAGITSPTLDANTLSLTSFEDQAKARQVLEQRGVSVTMSSDSAAPAWMSKLGLEPIDLGLDLRGGVQFLLKVDLAQAKTEKLAQIKSQLRTELRQDNIRGVLVSADADSVKIQASEHTLLKLKPRLRSAYPDYQLSDTDEGLLLSMKPQAEQSFNSELIRQNLKTLRGRIEELGITEAVTLRQGNDFIRIELPGVQDPQKAKRIIGATATLDIHEVKQGGKSYRYRGQQVSLNPLAVINGKNIVDARAGKDEMGMPMVTVSLDGVGGYKMSEFTRTHVGKPMATLYSEFSTDEAGELHKSTRLINLATIQQRLGNRFSITGIGNPAEANELALLLRAGSLSAPVTIVEQNTIGPGLGKENIEHGMAALVLGLGVTLSFMALWYRRLGLIANTALVFNLVSLLGLMSLLPGVVLTLPGIAGLVLTVGMAVDTNVLIFERIKQERKRGLSPYNALNAGYDKALSSIMDANITTLITAVILYAIGYGPIKGFAMTLGLGLLTSMFTGIYVSRGLSGLYYRKEEKLLQGVC